MVSATRKNQCGSLSSPEADSAADRRYQQMGCLFLKVLFCSITDGIMTAALVDEYIYTLPFKMHWVVSAIIGPEMNHHGQVL
jgi:hypothetical protein